jgi:CheY-like chemotaxis protein
MGQKVLIADDDRVFVELVGTRLRSKGLEVSVAFDAMQAMMVAVKSLPDAILLDVKMPGGTGLETLKKLKASMKTTHIPVVIASALDDPGLGESVKALGAAEFLRKPAAFDDVYAALCRVLGRKP